MYLNNAKVGCVLTMVIWSEFDDHREDAPHFTLIKLYPYPENGIRFSSSSS